MKFLISVATVLTLSAAMFAQAENTQTTPAQRDQPQVDRPAGQADRAPAMSSDANTRTFTGTIVNATCPQASNLPKPGTYADRGSSTASDSSKSATAKDTTAGSSSMDKNPKSVYDMQREVMSHCAANDKTTAFAVLTDDGSFYKLDDAGNTQVTSQAGGADSKQKKNVKNMRVTVTGVAQGETLKVQTLAKTDKPFSQ